MVVYSMNGQEDCRPSSVAVLGSTGSVGRQALDVAERLCIPVTLLSANRDTPLLEEQVRRFRPRICALGDAQAAASFALRVADTETKIYAGAAGIEQAISDCGAPVAVNAILGKAGLAPTLAVLRCGMRLALANKESLVIAGEAVMRAAEGNPILPVDSEHCAIFQCLEAGRRCEVKRLILTASGGPFFGYSADRLAHVTVADTLAHPTWQMGAKITVDSATMMNKGFEILEASHLFGIPPEQIQVVIHRESIIHSAVEYIDHAVIAQMSVPDMRLCVQHALTYPARMPGVVTELDLFRVGKLTFAPADEATFPLLPLAVSAGRAGGALPAVLNAANEAAVAAFLAGRLSFCGIFRVVGDTVAELDEARHESTLDGILYYDSLGRLRAEERIKGAFEH